MELLPLLTTGSEMMAKHLRLCAQKRSRRWKQRMERRRLPGLPVLLGVCPQGRVAAQAPLAHL